MSLRQLEYFVAVVDHGSFTKAAAHLSVSQPGLSHQLRALENDLGGPLLDRGTGSLALTPLGRATLPHARATLDAHAGLRRAAARTADGTAGTIALATITSISLGVLPPVLRRWLTDHDGRQVDIDEHHHVEPLWTSVRSGQNDLGVGPLPDGWDGPNWLLGHEEFLVVAAPEHRLAARTPPTVDIAELADDPWVQYASSHGLHGAVDSICSTAGFTPRVAARTEQTAAVTEYAAAGVGVTITLSNTIRPDHPGTILRPDPPIERAIHAFTHRTPDPLTTTLIDRLLTDTVLIPDHIHRRCGAGTAARTER